jgi:hypothetical protein
VYGADDVRPVEGQEIVVALEAKAVIGESFPPEVGLRETVGLQERAHCTVEDQYPPVEQYFEFLFDVSVHDCNGLNPCQS